MTRCLSCRKRRSLPFIYQLTRESLKLTREDASELLVTMFPERIEKIENERSMPHTVK